MQSNQQPRTRPIPTVWNCSSCSTENEAWSAVCKSCSTPKVGLFAKKGDFVCLSCGNHNYGSRSTCRICGVNRPVESGPATPFERRESRPMGDRQFQPRGDRQFQPRGDRQFQPRDGQQFQPDWKCPSCGSRVFGNRTTCFRPACGASKPENPELITTPREPRPFRADGENRDMNSQRRFQPRFQGDGQQRQVRKYEKREGDWSCSGCGEVNFGFRTECRKCNASKQ